jgi:hypothetical protein
VGIERRLCDISENTLPVLIEDLGKTTNDT